MLIDAWIRRAWNPRLLVDLAVLTVLVGAFSLVRLTGAFGVIAPPFSRYLVQRLFFETYGSLSVPWHENVLASAPWVAAVAAVLLIVLFAGFLTARRTDAPGMAPGAAVWMLVAVLPVAPILFVAPDLQASRYLYLAGPAWAGLVAGAAAMAPARLTRAAAAILAALVCAWAWGVRQHLAPWQAAAASRDGVLAVAGDNRFARCGEVALSGLPDNIEGAYVLRNGAPEAFARLGITVRSTAPPGCAFTWDEGAGRFVNPTP